MNAFHPEVQGFMLSLLKEVALKYEVDGIQGDDRLPALPSLAGYDNWTLEKYQSEHQGKQPPDDPFDDSWVEWRAGLLNDFMQQMHKELKAVRPDLTISVSPSIYPWSKEQYLQDWPSWVRNGWVDMVCPQVYRYNLGAIPAGIGKNHDGTSGKRAPSSYCPRHFSQSWRLLRFRYFNATICRRKPKIWH